MVGGLTLYHFHYFSHFIARSQNVKYCFNPCQYPGNYLFPNETCLSYCPAPFISRREPDVDYCFSPCIAPKIYWYVNFTCHAVCNFPYVKTSYSGVQQCVSPCQNVTDFYYKDENKCEATCDPPFLYAQADKVKVCSSEFSYDYATITQARKTLNLTKSLRNAANVLVKFPALLQINNPYSAFLGSYSAMAQYIRYMEVNYPDKLAALFIVSSYIPITASFGFKLPKSFQENLVDYSVPENFEKYEIHSNFLWNTWGLLESLLITLLIILIVVLLLRKYKMTFKPRIILEKIQQVMQWNLPLMMLCSTSTDIFFFGIIHLRTTRLNSFLSALSLFASLAMIFYIIWILSCVFRIVWALKKARKNPSDEAILFQEYRIQQIWKNYGLLYKNLNEKSLIKLAYIGIFILRGLIFSLIITCLYKFPLAQASLIIVLNSLMMIYIIFFKPLKRTLHRIQVLTNEILLMVLTVCVLSLAMFDSNNIESQQTRNNLGEAIIIMIIALNAFAVASLSMNLLMDLYSLYKKVKLLRIKLLFKGVEKSRFSLLPLIIFEELQTEPAIQELLNRPEDTTDPNRKRRIFKPSRRGPITTAEFHVGPINMPPESYMKNPMTTEDATPSTLTPELPSQFLTLSRSGSENNRDIDVLSDNSYKSPSVHSDGSAGALNKTFDFGKSPDASRVVIDSQDFTTNASRFTDQKPSLDNNDFSPPSKGKNTIISLFKKLRGKSSQPADPKLKAQKTKIKKPGKKNSQPSQPSGYQLDLSQTEPPISLTLPSEPSSRLSTFQLQIPQSVHNNKSISQPSQFSHFRLQTGPQSEIARSITPPSQFSGLRVETSPNESEIGRSITQPSQFSGLRVETSPNESRPVSRQSQLSQSEIGRFIAQPSQFSGHRVETSPNESRPVSRQSQLSQFSGLSGLGLRVQTTRSESNKLFEMEKRGEKASPNFEMESSVVSAGLSQESEISIQSRNTLIRDFRRLRERQNKTKEQKKNWYDNLRRSRDLD